VHDITACYKVIYKNKSYGTNTTGEVLLQIREKRSNAVNICRI
jgi:hypothetical protein